MFIFGNVLKGIKKLQDLIDMKTVILTGFEPFGNDSINPTQEVILEMAKSESKDVTLNTLILPVIYGKAIEILKTAIKNLKPDLILSLGQAGGRDTISIERVGININDTEIADNAGNSPKDELIEPNGPAAYFTTMEIRKTLNRIKENGIPAVISNSAGTYVCNNLIYGILHFLTNQKIMKNIKFGFIHIPYLPSQIAQKNKPMASMALSLVKAAVRIAIESNL